MTIKKKLGTVLFCGRKDCKHSDKIKNYLKKNSKKLHYFESKKRGERLNKKFTKIKFDYIFSFRSLCIIRNNILKKTVKAINFHPGPPEYRGIGCVNYALYENTKSYGCTAHFIEKKIDSGKIINVKKFKVNINDTIESVLTKTNRLMFRQAIFIIKKIINNKNIINIWIKKSNNIKWSKKIKNSEFLDKFYEIKKNDSKNIFLKKIRATYTRNYKPYIIIHNKKFILE